MNDNTLDIIFEFIDGYYLIDLVKVNKSFCDILLKNRKRIGAKIIKMKYGDIGEIEKNIGKIFWEISKKSTRPHSIDWINSCFIEKLGVDDYIYCFEIACREQKLFIAKSLYASNKINIHTMDSAAFKIACSKGNLEIAKWLYSLNISQYIDGNNCIELALEKNYVHIAIWLYDIHQFNIFLMNVYFIIFVIMAILIALYGIFLCLQ